MNIKIKRLKNSTGKTPPMPEYKTSGSAGFDLCAFIEKPLEILPGQLVTVPTGICIELMEGYCAFVYARSGLATRFGVTLSNCVGVVDSDYRGEIKVGLCNLSDQAYTISPLDRICQVVVTQTQKVTLCETDTLSSTERAEGGFGSTGK